MHFHEHDPIFWPRILDRVRDAGIEAVSTWVCPDTHRLPNGEFCFTGRVNRRTDLESFMDLCEERELVVHVQPGLGMLKPLCLDPPGESVEEWIAAVCSVLCGKQTSTNGPIALVGVDSGAMLPEALLSEHLGCEGRRSDLASQTALQIVWRQFCGWRASRAESWDPAGAELGVCPESGEDSSEVPPEPLHEMLIDEVGLWVTECLDAMIGRVAALYRNEGIEVPLYTTPPRLANLLGWQGSPALKGVGVELFAPLEHHDGCLTLNWMVRWASASAEHPWVPRVQVGAPAELGEYWFPAPEQGESMVMMVQAAGLRGADVCMFVEHGRWRFSPVNATGKIRMERYEPLSKAVASSKALSVVDEQLADVGLLWSPRDYSLACTEHGYGWQDLWREQGPPAPGQWWEVFRHLVARDVDFRLWIPEMSHGPVPQLLVHAGRPASTSEQLSALIRGVERAEVLLEITPAIASDVDVGADPDPGWRRELEDAIDVMPANGRDLVATLRQLGARSYARAPQESIWTWVHRLGDSLLLGAWNAGERPFTGEIQLSPGLFDSQRSYRVEEPGLRVVATLPGEQLRAIAATLDAGAARVYRIAPTST